MFIAVSANRQYTPFGGAEFNWCFTTPETIPLLRTEPEEI